MSVRNLAILCATFILVVVLGVGSLIYARVNEPVTVVICGAQTEVFAQQVAVPDRCDSRHRDGWWGHNFRGDMPGDLSGVPGFPGGNMPTWPGNVGVLPGAAVGGAVIPPSTPQNIPSATTPATTPATTSPVSRTLRKTLTVQLPAASPSFATAVVTAVCPANMSAVSGTVALPPAATSTAPHVTSAAAGPNGTSWRVRFSLGTVASPVRVTALCRAN